MSEPLKPRIDFAEPLQPPQEPVLRAGLEFDEQQAEKFYPAAPEMEQEEEEGRAEGIVNAALKPKRSLWRKMVNAGLMLFGVSVVAQGVQWVHTSWVQQDWIALGGGIAGGLIVFAGIGSVVGNGAGYTAYANVQKSVTKLGNCCTVTAWGEGASFVKSWRVRPGWIKGTRIATLAGFIT